MKCIGLCAMAFFLVMGTSGSATAQGRLYRGSATVHAGSTAGGSVTDAVLTAGGSVAVQEESGWGAEIDFAIANDDNAQHREADLTTGMINVNWIKPRGPLRPLVTIGVGAIGVHGCLLPCPQVTTTWNLGIGGGVGARYDLNDVFGLGGDVRLFIAPGSHAGTSRPDNFRFWRVAFGATFSWAILP